MAGSGLRPVEKPSALFLSQSETMKPGSAVVSCVEGSRPLLVEIQSLVSRTHFGAPRRLATGVDPQRLALLSAVLEKRLGVDLWDQDIYLNVVGGLEVEEPAADLAIVASHPFQLVEQAADGFDRGVWRSRAGRRNSSGHVFRNETEGSSDARLHARGYAPSLSAPEPTFQRDGDSPGSQHPGSTVRAVWA